jgi:hypothetical protein
MGHCDAAGVFLRTNGDGDSDDSRASAHFSQLVD